MQSIEDVLKITNRISMELLGNKFKLRVEKDVMGGDRIFIQIIYMAPCTKTGNITEFKGRKWYLSSHMTENECIFTVYTAYELCIRHELMESFKIDSIVLVNPHVDYKELLKISHNEVVRVPRVVVEEAGVVII